MCVLTWYHQPLPPLRWLWLVRWSVLQWGRLYSAPRWLNSSPAENVKNGEQRGEKWCSDVPVPPSCYTLSITSTLRQINLTKVFTCTDTKKSTDQTSFCSFFHILVTLLSLSSLMSICVLLSMLTQDKIVFKCIVLMWTRSQVSIWAGTSNKASHLYRYRHRQHSVCCHAKQLRLCWLADRLTDCLCVDFTQFWTQGKGERRLLCGSSDTHMLVQSCCSL